MVLSLFCKEGLGWQLFSGWACLSPRSPCVPLGWRGQCCWDWKGLTLANMDGVFPRLHYGSRWMRGVEEISCPPKCSDSIGAGSGPVCLVFLHLHSCSQSHCWCMGMMGACSGSWGAWDTPCIHASPPAAGAAWVAACRAATPEPSLPVCLPWQPAWDRGRVRARAFPSRPAIVLKFHHHH